MHAEIEAKREKRRKEEKALSEELKAIKIKNQFLGADKEAVERKKWASQQAGVLSARSRRSSGRSRRRR